MLCGDRREIYMVELISGESVFARRAHVFPLVSIAILNLPRHWQVPLVSLVGSDGPVDLNRRHLLRSLEVVFHPLFGAVMVAPYKEWNALVARSFWLDLIIESASAPRTNGRITPALGCDGRNRPSNLVFHIAG